MPALLEEAVRNDVRAATRAAAVEAAPEVLRRIRDAFEIFDNQSALLRNSFESLKQNLAA